MAKKLKFEIKYVKEDTPRIVEDTYGVFRFSTKLTFNNHIAILSNTNLNSKKLLEIFNDQLEIEYLKVSLDDKIIEEQQNVKMSSYENTYGYLNSKEYPIEQIIMDISIPLS